MNKASFSASKISKTYFKKKITYIVKNYDLYILLSFTMVFIFIFCYIPMSGVLLAFKDYSPVKGILGSAWANPLLKNFNVFLSSKFFGQIIWNTVSISTYSIIVNTVIPVIFALFLNEVRTKWFRRTIQTVTYAPHFISMVIVVGIILTLTSESGLINTVIKMFGSEPIRFMEESKYFRTIYIVSGVWQGMGWWSIIYIATLSGVDLQLYDAANVDGANILQKIWYINIPALTTTIVSLFILSAGGILSVGFEKTFLMQNPLNSPVSEVISTYVYKVGLVGARYEFSTAVSLFNSIISFFILILTNWLAKKAGEPGIM
jgi:putative aldouronate transport system permease protein